MKHLARIFAVLGFIFQYAIPLALVSTIVSLTKEKKAGLTVAGILVAVVLALIILSKLKDKINQLKNNITKQALLSVSPFAIWGMGFLAINYLSTAIASLEGYWIKIAPFILIGRLLYIVSGIFKNEAEEQAETEKEKALIDKIKGEL